MKILAYTSPARGHLFPLVPMLDELARRGHADRGADARLARWRRCAARGFDAAPIAPAIEAIEHDDYLGRTPAGASCSGRWPCSASGRRTRSATCVPLSTSTRPDALLVDCMSWGAAAAAEAWGGPWAQWFPYPLPLRSRDVPPVRTRAAARRAGRSAACATARSARARRASGARDPARRSTGPGVEAGVPGARRGRRAVHRGAAAALHDRRAVRVPALGLAGDGPDGRPVPVGPAGRGAAWLDEVDRPLVLVSTSSEFQDDGRLVTRGARGARRRGRPRSSRRCRRPTLPVARARRTRASSASSRTAPILERAACAITHGGMGATQKALAAGVPVLRRAVRARPARGRAPRRGRRRRHAPAGDAADRGPAARAPCASAMAHARRARAAWPRASPPPAAPSPRPTSSRRSRPPGPGRGAASRRRTVAEQRRCARGRRPARMSAGRLGCGAVRERLVGCGTARPAGPGTGGRPVGTLDARAPPAARGCEGICFERAIDDRARCPVGSRLAERPDRLVAVGGRDRDADPRAGAVGVALVVERDRDLDEAVRRHRRDVGLPAGSAPARAACSWRRRACARWPAPSRSARRSPCRRAGPR